MMLENSVANLDLLLADSTFDELGLDLDFKQITNRGLVYSTLAEEFVTKHKILFDRAEIENNRVSIVINAATADSQTSLRVVATNAGEIFTNLDFENLDAAKSTIFFPADRRCFNKQLQFGTRATDLIWKKGENTINFRDFVVEEELHLFFIFYYEDDDNFEIYQYNLITNDRIQDEATIDRRLPKISSYEFDYTPRTDLSYLTIKQNKALFSKFYNTADPSGNLRFLFSFDLLRYFENHFLFPEFMTFLDIRESLQHFEVERYWQARSVGFMMKDNRYPKTLPIHILDNIASEGSPGVVFFGGVDNGAKKGVYTYKANIVLKDITIDEAEDRIKLLRKIYDEILIVPAEMLDTAEALYDLVDKFSREFSFLSDRLNTRTRFSEETKEVIMEKIDSAVRRLEQRLTIKKSTNITKDLSRARLLYSKSHNSRESARRSHVVENTFPDVENKNYKSVAFAPTEDRGVSFRSISFGNLKDYVTMYKQNSKILLVNKEEPLESISAFDEHVEKYDEGLVVGKIEEDTPGHYVNVKRSMHAGAIEKRELIPQKKSKYKIQISKTTKECKLEFLSNYKTSNIDNTTSIHSESWIEIKSVGDIDRLSNSNSSVLVRMNLPEPVYDKYFFVE